MKSIIVGTAGHIDHGKTALVKALTGIDADRLEEEKRRGITIDIGFAHLELPAESGETIRVSFIDVPGHERFVRNMLAGIGGIDLVLLIIAADESIKPQTREHFDICRLLSVRRGITVLTKPDLVDEETLDVVRLEVAEFVRGSFLDTSQSPIISVSSLTCAGIDQLKQELRKLSLEVAARDFAGVPRLPIDRVFSMKGFGTVVTGTLLSGTIRCEDEIEVFPSQKRIRVRGIQVHGRAVDKAVAGQRTAINVAGAGVEEMSRGMTLSLSGTFESTKRLDVSLSLLKSAKPLKHRARLQFHCYTTEMSAEVFLYGENTLASGEDSYAQLRLTNPALMLPGDRFIIRQFSPAKTIGGGIVLDSMPLDQSVKVPVRLNFLRILKVGSIAEALRARVAQWGMQGINIAEIVAQTGWTSQRIESTAGVLPEIVRVDDCLITASALDQIRTSIVSTLDTFHKQNPLVTGIGREELKGRLPAHPTTVFEALIDGLIGAKAIQIAGELLRLPGRGVVMKDEETKSKQTIETAFASAGLRVPALKDVLAELKIDKLRAQKIVTLLLREKTLVKISDDLVFHAGALDALRKTLSAQKTKSPRMDVARFKEMTGVSRKYAIPLLEYLDRERVTKRVGDTREIL